MPLLLIGRLQLAQPDQFGGLVGAGGVGSGGGGGSSGGGGSTEQLSLLLRMLQALLHMRPVTHAQMQQFDGAAVLGWLMLRVPATQVRATTPNMSTPREEQGRPCG